MFSGKDGTLRLARPGDSDIFGEDVPGATPATATPALGPAEDTHFWVVDFLKRMWDGDVIR